MSFSERFRQFQSQISIERSTNSLSIMCFPTTTKWKIKNYREFFFALIISWFCAIWSMEIKPNEKKKYKWISQACRGFSDTAMKTADDLLQSNQIQNVINGLLFLIFRSVCLCFSFQNNILNMTHIIITIFYENIRFLFIDLVISNGWQTEFHLIEINGPRISYNRSN